MTTSSRLLGATHVVASKMARKGVLSRERSRPDSRIQGEDMGDKSPRQSMTKKSGKSLKEKRADKRSKANAASQQPIIAPGKKG